MDKTLGQIAYEDSAARSYVLVYGWNSLMPEIQQEWEAIAAAVAAAVKEEDARIVRGLIEGTHECTAEEASREAGLDEEDELRRLRHWSDVYLKNATLRSAADFILASIKEVK